MSRLNQVSSCEVSFTETGLGPSKKELELTNSIPTQFKICCGNWNWKIWKKVNWPGIEGKGTLDIFVMLILIKMVFLQ